MRPSKSVFRRDARATQFPNVAHFRTVPRGKLFLQEEYPETVAEWLLGFAAGGG